MGPSGSERAEARGRELACSFCGKRRDQVEGVVAGPTPSVVICNECVDLCAEVLAEHRENGDRPPEFT
jgi:ATP-dependent Clp protease ATP-binding subunit ClpX